MPTWQQTDATITQQAASFYGIVTFTLQEQAFVHDSWWIALQRRVTKEFLRKATDFQAVQ